MYKVFGWKIHKCEHFERKFKSLFMAVRFFLKQERTGKFRVFIEGISSSHEKRLEKICSKLKVQGI